MKWMVIFLTVFTVHLSAAVRSQTVTFSGKKVPLESVFDAIKKQTGYVVLYKAALLDQAAPVTVAATKEPLTAFLGRVLKDQDMEFEITRTSILITKKMTPSPKAVAVKEEEAKAAAPPVTVNGKVVNEKGEPMIGVSVMIQGSKRGTTTNGEGEFLLTAVDPEAVLVISAANVEKAEFALNGRTNVTIAAKTRVSKLDQTVVVAYGKTSQRFSTGNVTTVSSAQIENKPVINPILALQGEAPGIFVNQTSGYANAGIQIQIQGIGSLQSATDPLYIVDGVPFASQLPGNMTGSGISGARQQGSAGNPLNYINPQDIESISVLKDADATAIYGSRGANGVVLITTKKGKAGASRVTLNLQQGLMKVSKFLKVMNTAQYLQMRRDAYFGTDGLTTSSPDWATQYDMNGTWDTTRNTDWQKALINKTAQYTDLSAAVEGGSETDIYRISADYHKQTTIFNYTNANDQKGSFSFNFNHSSKDKKFRLNFSTNYQVDFNYVPVEDLTFKSILLAPDAPALFKADGTLNWQPDASGTSSWTNPVASNLTSKKYGKTSNLVSNLMLSYRIWKGLEFSSSFGYTALQMDELMTYPLSGAAPEAVAYGAKASSVFNTGATNGWQAEPQLKYNTQLAKGVLDVLVGSTFQKNNVNQQSIYASNYANDLLLESLQAAGSVSAGGTTITQYKYNGVFARAGYNWDGKYLINLTGRRDGSSRFGANNLFHDFWSAGGAWIFTEEKAVKSVLPWLSFGKLKASYGTTGSDQIGDYKFLNLYESESYPVNYQGIVSLSPSGLPNPNLQWEETRKFSSGLNLGFFSDRLLIETNYYVNRCSNQLLPYKLPGIAGFTFTFVNFPATVQNSGFEFNLHTVNIKARDLTWTSSFNISLNRNKLVSFPNLSQSSYASSLIIGKPAIVSRFFKYAGLNEQTGLYQFYDAGHHLTSELSYATDQTEMVDMLPAYFGGFQNGFNYKGLQLDVLFTFAKQVITGNTFGGVVPAGLMGWNQPASMAGNYWTSPGQHKQFQKVSSTYGGPGIYDALSYATLSSAFYKNVFYAKLKNVSLSYRLPEQWLNKANLKNVRIYANAQNLFTISRYDGIDPESGVRTMGPLRTLVFGIQVGL